MGLVLLLSHSVSPHTCWYYCMQQHQLSISGRTCTLSSPVYIGVVLCMPIGLPKLGGSQYVCLNLPSSARQANKLPLLQHTYMYILAHHNVPFLGHELAIQLSQPENLLLVNMYAFLNLLIWFHSTLVVELFASRRFSFKYMESLFFLVQIKYECKLSMQFYSAFLIVTFKKIPSHCITLVRHF